MIALLIMSYINEILEYNIIDPQMRTAFCVSACVCVMFLEANIMCACAVCMYTCAWICMCSYLSYIGGGGGGGVVDKTTQRYRLIILFRKRFGLQTDVERVISST